MKFNLLRMTMLTALFCSTGLVTTAAETGQDTDAAQKPAENDDRFVDWDAVAYDKLREVCVRGYEETVRFYKNTSPWGRVVYPLRVLSGLAFGWFAIRQWFW